ncbi:MAG: acyl-CoA thioesterase [Thaumarchaeota archaeon]|nr:acyl-CoA thioesterase [Nitrososphaerota archaeon]
MTSWHESRLRVRFEETDMMGVVYYAKFFVWMEVGRIGLLRDIDVPYKEWERRGFHIPVVQAHADYKTSARLDEEILVKTRVASLGRTSIKFENETYKLPEMKLLCTGHTVHSLIDSSEKAVPIPDDLRANLTSS